MHVQKISAHAPPGGLPTVPTVPNVVVPDVADLQSLVIAAITQTGIVQALQENHNGLLELKQNQLTTVSEANTLVDELSSTILKMNLNMVSQDRVLAEQVQTSRNLMRRQVQVSEDRSLDRDNVVMPNQQQTEARVCTTQILSDGRMGMMQQTIEEQQRKINTPQHERSISSFDDVHNPRSREEEGHRQNRPNNRTYMGEDLRDLRWKRGGK